MITLNTYKSIRANGIRTIEPKQWCDSKDDMIMPISHNCRYGLLHENELFILILSGIEHLCFFDISFSEFRADGSNMSFRSINDQTVYIRLYYIPRGKGTEIVINKLSSGKKIFRKVVAGISFVNFRDLADIPIWGLPITELSHFAKNKVFNKVKDKVSTLYGIRINDLWTAGY